MTETASVQKEDTNVDPSLASLSRKCSNCGQTGHNSRTCLEIRETAASEAELKSSAAVSLSTHNTLVSAEQQTDRTSRDEEAEVSDCTADISRETKKKGIAWTEEEHKLFLKGLQKLGKGDWRGISRQFVQSRSPTQVASHAQKYFIRQSVTGKRKRRSSLFDLVPEVAQDMENAAPTEFAQQSKTRDQAFSHPSTDALQPPSQAFPPMPQGPEAFAFACWYQSMLLQQGSMAWIQAVCGQQNPFSPTNPTAFHRDPEAQGAQGMKAGPALTREKQMAIASLAAQQQAAAYMAQQHLSAAAAMGAIPYPPSQGPGTGKPHMPDIKDFFRPEQTDLSGQPSYSSMTTQQPLQRSDSLELSECGLLRHHSNTQAPGEVFGNGMLVKPKAHRAQSGRSFGSVPSYMCSSQSEGQTQFSGSSKESENSLARLWHEQQTRP